MRFLAALAFVPTSAFAHPETSPAPAPSPPPSADRWLSVTGMYDHANDGTGVRVELDLFAHAGWRLGAAVSTAGTSSELQFNGIMNGYLTLRDHKLMAVAAYELRFEGLLVRGALGAGVVQTTAEGTVQPYAYGNPNARDVTRGDGVFDVVEASLSVAAPVSASWALTAGVLVTRYDEMLHLTNVSVARAPTEVMWMGGVKRRL
jgi:hypothetical protein